MADTAAALDRYDRCHAIIARQREIVALKQELAAVRLDFGRRGARWLELTQEFTKLQDELNSLLGAAEQG